MDPRAVSDLLSDEGRALLASLPPYDEKQAVALTTRLRAEGHPAELVAAALTQSRLRTRAVEKFGDAASSMFFTPDALEQATRAPIAALHAERLRAAGAELVIDGGCGIGADAVGFVRAGLGVIGVEADEATARLAAANLAGVRGHPTASSPSSAVDGDVAAASSHANESPAAGSPSGASDARVATTGPERSGRLCRVDVGTLEALAPRLRQEHPDAAWWFDPARRTPGVADIRGRTKRTFSLAALSPSWDLVRELAAQAPAAGAKLSPSLAHTDVPDGCEAEFVSYAGDVVEATVWWGAAVRTPGRSATIVRPGREPLHVTQADVGDTHDRNPDAGLATRATLGAYFYEADKALTRSGLVGALLAAVDGHEFAAGYGYVTADAAHDVGLLGRGYRVIDAVPWATKTFRAYLRERGVGRLTIKKRDVDVDADALRRSLKLKGTHELTVVLVDLDGERLALVVEPLTTG